MITFLYRLREKPHKCLRFILLCNSQIQDVIRAINLDNHKTQIHTIVSLKKELVYEVSTMN